MLDGLAWPSDSHWQSTHTGTGTQSPTESHTRSRTHARTHTHENAHINTHDLTIFPAGPRGAAALDDFDAKARARPPARAPPSPHYGTLIRGRKLNPATLRPKSEAGCTCASILRRSCPVISRERRNYASVACPVILRDRRDYASVACL